MDESEQDYQYRCNLCGFNTDHSQEAIKQAQMLVHMSEAHPIEWEFAMLTKDLEDPEVQGG
jgi:hypothetical protein